MRYYNLYKVKVIIDNIDGYNGGYKDIEEEYKIIATTKFQAEQKAINYAKEENYNLLNSKCYAVRVISVLIEKEILF